MQINLLGYYGFHNIGDDLMLQNLCTYFLNSGKVQQINVFCRHAYYSSRPGVRYYPLNRFSRLQKAFLLIKNRYTFWGGGTCIYQAENSKGLFELRRLQKIVKTFGNRFGFLGIGIGQLRDEKYISTAKKLLLDSDYNYFRDADSLQKAASLTDRDDLLLGGDLVFLSDITPQIHASKDIKKISFSANYNGTSQSADYYSSQLLNIINYFKCKLYFLPAHTGIDFNDNDFHHKIAEKLPAGTFHICDWKQPVDFIQKLADMDFHIGSRLHSLVLADMLGIPGIGITHSPKIKYYLQKSANISPLRIVEPGSQILPEHIREIKNKYRVKPEFINSERLSIIDCLEKILADV
ncbi:MAG: polysaccharide pyruvyl transferase family protein [Candidatus Cloacimonetes bacterium]|nr:polysaccharide pyruvyl transferase family protein [Candidatus Cloacimonadota bacterium]